MFVRAYLRASTEEQDAGRAAVALADFAEQYSHTIAAHYIEHASGARTERPELRRLLDDAGSGDVLLVEAIDRLSRLPVEDWNQLRRDIEAKGMRVVSVDLPTSYPGMQAAQGDEFTARMLDAINSMMLDMMAAMARKDYEQRRERQAEGIAKAKAAGVYQGRQRDQRKRQRIADALEAGFSIRKTARLVQASSTTVQTVRRDGV